VPVDYPIAEVLEEINAAIPHPMSIPMTVDWFFMDIPPAIFHASNSTMEILPQIDEKFLFNNFK